jgi:hypothetical protein
MAGCVGNSGLAVVSDVDRLECAAEQVVQVQCYTARDIEWRDGSRASRGVLASERNMFKHQCGLGLVVFPFSQPSRQQCRVGALSQAYALVIVVTPRLRLGRLTLRVRFH